MANTYSSWEYSQGPNLYIDSSGFKSIDDKKNFVYYYIVTYSPVEYKRKVTDEKGVSTYEFKYSFGSDNSARKVLEECEFSGKDQVTKTVTHTVTESGFKDTITKTFHIDTNIGSNLDVNRPDTVNPYFRINATNWTFDSGSGLGSNNQPPIWNDKYYFGWVTQTKTGQRTEYRTESYTYYETESYPVYYTEWEYGIVDWAWYSALVNAGEDYTQYPIYNWYEVTRVSYEYRTVARTGYRQVPYTVNYTYTELYNSHCTLDLKAVRDKIGDYDEYASIAFCIRTGKALNKPPKLYMDTGTSSTNLRTELQPKNSGAVGANELIEYYLPLKLVIETFKNYSSVKIILQKGNCNSTEGYITEAYAYVELDTAGIPYLNLVVQAYSNETQQWFTACTIPYLNYLEIDELKNNKSAMSKNLFFPNDLPKTDTTYRIQLDTNLAAKDYERLTNFRIDVLSKQLIPPGSIEDRKVFISNDTLDYDYEIEVGSVDELKLNALGYDKFKANTVPGFLQKGANDVAAYLRPTSCVSTEGFDEKSTNGWLSYVSNKNGNWVSNNIFMANSFDFPEVGILQSGENLKNEILTFNIPYNNLKPNSTYVLKFIVNAKQGFSISDLNTINANDVNKITKSTLYTESIADSAKCTIDNANTVFYSPMYKIKDGETMQYVDEFSVCDMDVNLEVVIKTKNVTASDTGHITLRIVRNAIKNLTIKGMHCTCTDSAGVKYIDVIEPYNIDIDTGRQNESNLVIYYDGFHIEHINPLLYDNMAYLREELNKIREQYELPAYEWKAWVNQFTGKDTVKVDKWGHGYGVEKGQPLRAAHFNEVKECCIDTYTKLLQLKPPVSLNTSPSMFRNNVNLIPLDDADPSQGYVLQHYKDKDGNIMDIDRYFPEWRQLIDLINRN